MSSRLSRAGVRLIGQRIEFLELTSLGLPHRLFQIGFNA
jgi:hypothetical protein